MGNTTKPRNLPSKHKGQAICHCKAYSFPHRPNSGRCGTEDEAPYCGECGLPCKAVIIDFGIGPYEFWGAPGIDIDNRLVSDCCNAEMYFDIGLQEDYYE